MVLLAAVAVGAQPSAVASSQSVAGADPYVTAVEMATLVGGGSLSGLDRLIVVTGESFPDAVVASGLAGFLDEGGRSGRTGILLTRANELPAVVADAIGVSGVAAAQVLMVGGTAAVSDDVRAAVARAAGWNGVGANPVTRIAGEDRYETAAAIVDYVVTAAGAGLAASYRTVLVASGEQFPDALATGAFAYRNGHLLVLSRQSDTPTAALDAVRGLQANCAVLVGGTTALAPRVATEVTAALTNPDAGCGVERIAGRDRFDTAAQVAARFVAANGPPREALVASGETFGDALTVGPLAGGNRPLLLTSPNHLSAPAVRWLLQHRATLTNVRVIGGTTSINPEVTDQITDATRPVPAPVVAPAPSAPAPTAPAAPTIESVTAGNATLSVAFNPGGDGGSAITNYEYSTDGGATWTARSPDNTASPLVITGLDNGTTYNVQIRAINAVGSGAASNTISGTPTPFVVGSTGPGGGIVFYVHPSGGTFTVTGSACATTCRYLEAAPAPDGGDVERKWATATDAPNNQTTPVPGALATILGAGLKNTEAVTQQAGNLAASSAAVYAWEYSTTVDGVVVSDWFLPSRDELNELCKYAKNTGQAAGSGVRCSGGVAATDRGFAAGFYWSSSEVSAANAWYQGFGNGGQSGIAKSANYQVRPVRAFGLPLAPSITSVTAGNATLSVAFNAEGDGGSAITNYEYSIDNGATWTARAPVSTASPLVITGLVNGTTYSVRIRAVNAVGSGAVSNMVAGTPATVPAAPSITSVTAGNATLSVAFTAGGDGGSAITNYEYSTDGGATWRARATGTTGSPLVITNISGAADTALVNGTPYSVRIRAVNAVGSGAASDPETGTPATPVYAVGATGPGGGWVFYVSATPFTVAGSDCNTACHYLEAFPIDVGDTHQWKETDTETTGTSTVLGSGHNNTYVAMAGDAHPAAAAARNASHGGKDDWFLPSKDELNELCKYAKNTGQAAGSAEMCSGGFAPSVRGFANSSYWSSSEATAPHAWFQNFTGGVQDNSVKAFSFRVRPVRAF